MIRSSCAVGLVSAMLLSSSSSALTHDGLIYYQDFDHDGRAACGAGWALDQDIDPERLVPGRYGKACRFERSSANLLSPNQASAEEDATGFVPGDGTRLASTNDDTPFGARVLNATVDAPGIVWHTTPTLTRVKAPHRPNKVFLFSAYIKASQDGTQVRLSLRDEHEDSDWRDRVETAIAAAAEKGGKPAKPVFETISAPATVTLGKAWQRVAARFEIDARREEQSLVARLELVSGESGTLSTDGMQLEQTCVYPLSNTEPTSWLPGGATRTPKWIDMPLSETGFSGRVGTLGCWIRPIPDQCGGSRKVNAIVTLGKSWWAPVWQLGGGRWYVGEAPTKQKQGKVSARSVEKGLLETGGNDGWHFLALAWDEEEAVGFLDGKPFGRTSLASGRPIPGSELRLGGSFLERVPMTGDLDEVYLFDRRLTDADIAALAAAEKPMAEALPNVLLRRPQRLTFLRSEESAELALEPVSYGTSPGRLALTAQVPGLAAECRQMAEPGAPAQLRIRPWMGSPGSYELTVTATSPAHSLVARDRIDVFEEPPGREFITYAWGGTDEDLEERGFNCLFGEPRALLERGLWATIRIDVRTPVPHPWSAETRARADAAAGRVARGAMSHANVRACLVNSECGHPPFPADEPWFLDWLREETGLDGIPPEIARSPVRAVSHNGAVPPAVLPDDYPPYRFLRWWTKRGQGYYLLNNHITRQMRKAGLQTTYYSDQPETATQFEAMDLVDFWGYPKTPEGLVARFAHASCLARLDGKPFQAMPGTIYWDDGNGLWLNDADGKRKVLCLSPDCLTENLWISVACPSSSIGLYGIGERRSGIYDRACDAAMTNAYRLIRPVGTLVGGLPTEQAKVALLETDGLFFTQPEVNDAWMRHWLVRTASRCMARVRLPFDWIHDDHIYAGWLDHYSAVVVPGAWCLPEKTHRALVDFAQRGGKVIVDQAMRAEIPNALRLGIKTQKYPVETVMQELGNWADSFRGEHRVWAHVTPSDDVFTYTRDAGKARYLFVINDRREPGPQQQRWDVKLNAIGRAKNEPLRDRGLPHRVNVSLPAGLAVYDVLSHSPVTGTAENGRQVLNVSLGPGGAALLATFPHPIAELNVRTPRKLAPGQEATINLTVLDTEQRPVPGRLLTEIQVTRPSGEIWTGVSRYRRIIDGKLSVPLRLPLTAEQGTWQVTVLEWVSGLREKTQFSVE